VGFFFFFFFLANFRKNFDLKICDFDQCKGFFHEEKKKVQICQISKIKKKIQIARFLQ
jgi:hypothetical protein